jgi:plastocyanin
VRPGQSVTWVNCEEAGSERHTSTAQSGAWDSPLLDAGAHYTRVFDGSGRFAYTCLPHPHMRGTVIVE